MVEIEFMCPVEVDYKAVILRQHEYICNVDMTFRRHFRPEWLDDKYIADMLYDLDKIVVKDRILFYGDNKEYGEIDIHNGFPKGFKSLILLYYKPELILHGTMCGEDCFKYIFDISKKHGTVRMTLGYLMNIGDYFNKGLQVRIVNADKIVTTYREFLEEWLKFRMANDYDRMGCGVMPKDFWDKLDEYNHGSKDYVI